MKSKLIIVEELPHSEKISTAAMVAEELQKKGQRVICAGPAGLAYPDDFADFEAERKNVLDKWRIFAEKADKDTVFVCAGGCIHYVSTAVMRYGLDAEAAGRYAAEIVQAVKTLNPIMIYIDQNDISETAALWHTGTDAASGCKVREYEGKGFSDREEYFQYLKEQRMHELHILQELDMDSYIVSSEICEEEVKELFQSAGWDNLPPEQICLAVENSTKTFVIRRKAVPLAMISWLGDYGLHWFMKDFVVRKEYQGRRIGTFLYRFSENYIKSTMRKGWKVSIDLRAARGKENFYRKLGFRILTEKETGSGMEKIIER